MKSIIYLFSILILSVAPLRITAQVTLYPPQNLQGESIECNVYLTWDKPELPGGGTPPGLIGYNVYKNGIFYSYVSGQDTTWLYDLNALCPTNINTYWVTAFYDLTPYGNPGEYGESSPSDTITKQVICSCCLPFNEPWDQASFAYNDWRFIPVQSNWSISTQQGYPPPTAVFTGAPSLLNYAATLASTYLSTYYLTGCTNLYLDFDLKLDNVTASGTELMTVILEHCGEPVDTLLTLSNVAGFDWTHYRMLINDGRGGSNRILFTASGQNSANIQQWLIDNIVVDFKCRPPVNVDVLNQGDTAVSITWDPPECDMGTIPNWDHLTGYNIYRSDSAGNPPFYKLNNSPITAGVYIDFCPSWWDPSLLRYYVTDLQHDSATYTFLCESEPSDTVTAHFVGIDPMCRSTLNIYPNPNNGVFTTDLPPDALAVEVRNLQGVVVWTGDVRPMGQNQLQTDISDQPPGLYVVTVYSRSSTVRSKVVIY